jgi:hypothetical protein
MISAPDYEPGSPPAASRDERRTEVAGAWRMGWLRTLLLAAAAGIVLLLMPSFLAAYPLIILCHMLVFSIACLALNLVYGTAGMLSLGHAAYFGVAAYTGAFLYRFSAVDSFELYLLSGILSSTIFAAVIGFLCVRTTKIFFSILTFALSMVVYSLVINGAVFRLFGGVGWGLYLLGGGSMYLPRLSILGREFAASEFIPAFYNVIVAAFMHPPFFCGGSAARRSGKLSWLFETTRRARPLSAFRCGSIDGTRSSYPASSWVSPEAYTGNWRVKSHLTNSIGCSRRNWCSPPSWVARATS